MPKTSKSKFSIIFTVLLVILLVFAAGCTKEGNNEQSENKNSQPPISEGVEMSLPGVGPNTIAEIVEAASPAVVKIETVVIEETQNPFLNDPFFRQFFGVPQQPQYQERTGLGSGFIISQEGYILTNEHVVDGAKEIQVRIKGRDKPVPAKVIGADFDLDLAVLKIPGSKDLPTLKMGSSEQIRVGNWVIAIGSPYGLEDTVTVGVISAKERPVSVQDRHYKHLLQTDASINPGNSGGPLLNLQGEVVGINTAVNAQAQGIGFAIPTSTVKEVLDDLIEEGRVVRPWMGVQIQTVTPDLAQYFRLNQDWGVVITMVLRGSPAEKSGLKTGDVIVALDGERVENTDKLTDIVRAKQVGDPLEVEIIRDGKRAQVKLIVEERPADSR
ncbi:S1C family serine protease [Desulfofalx alkaliphila]|uniref:S1C family serine protease n=1 Tax=Desulfofalx alkaliphila TaxID=105483 RepID=UPI0004E2288E|nr:trypsin-like peptidase domain-containing protein [Desulfofalx alkaliphila]